ncbi:hypothetical protein Rs2_16324 [Raphanus sativus]|nr:hypothetical protein Rs2_16324 [Raphanus sativus]
MANSKTAHYRRLRLISFLNYVFPKHEDDEDLNIVTGGLLIGLEMLLKRSKRENLLLVTHLMKSDQLLCFRLISQVGSSLSDGKYLMQQNTLCLTVKRATRYSFYHSLL